MIKQNGAEHGLQLLRCGAANQKEGGIEGLGVGIDLIIYFLPAVGEHFAVRVEKRRKAFRLPGVLWGPVLRRGGQAAGAVHRNKIRPVLCQGRCFSRRAAAFLWGGGGKAALPQKGGECRRKQAAFSLNIKQRQRQKNCQKNKEKGFSGFFHRCTAFLVSGNLCAPRRGTAK